MSELMKLEARSVELLAKCREIKTLLQKFTHASTSYLGKEPAKKIRAMIADY